MCNNLNRVVAVVIEDKINVSTLIWVH